MNTKLPANVVSAPIRRVLPYRFHVRTPAPVIAPVIALVIALATGCSGDDRNKNPVRVLAASIRTQDLVRWCHDAGVTPTPAQWIEIDAHHDRYLARVLQVRTPARERLTDLFKAGDNDEAIPLDLELRTERSAAGTNHDFSVQIASLDDEFIASLTTTDLINPVIAQSFLQRRRLERLSFLLNLSNTPAAATMLVGSPDPLELIFEAWPEDAPRDSNAIAEWTTRNVDLVLPAAQRRWKLRCEGRTKFIEAESAADDPSTSEDHKTQLDKRHTRLSERELAASNEAVRAIQLVLTQDAVGIPTQAREAAMRAFLREVGASKHAAALERAYATASNLAGGEVARVQQIHAAREQWRSERRALIECASPTLHDDSTLVAKKLAELLGRISDEGAKRLVKDAYANPPQVAPVEIPDEQDDQQNPAVEKYRNLRHIGFIASPPPRHFLRTIARLARLDEEQEALFVDDAREQWLTLMTEESQRIERAEEVLKGMASRMMSDPAELSRALELAMKEAVSAPLAHADALDVELAETLLDRANAFGGQPEPAATLWRVVRALPPEGWRDPHHPPIARVTTGDQRVFVSSAPASVGVLACDTTLSTLTRTVLLDLIVEHQQALIAEAQALRLARATSVPPIVRAIVLTQSDPLEGKRATYAALRIFRQADERFQQLQQSIVNKAAAFLPDVDAHMLRYRRAELFVPELFVEGSSLFASDRARARTLAQSLSNGADTALQLLLESDDLALTAAVLASLESDLDAQPSSQVLDRQYRRDEPLVEQSLKRIDRAARAARDRDAQRR